MMFHLSPRATPLYTGLWAGAPARQGPVSKHGGAALKKLIPGKVLEHTSLFDTPFVLHAVGWLSACMIHIVFTFFLFLFFTEVNQIKKQNKMSEKKQQ